MPLNDRGISDYNGPCCEKVKNIAMYYKILHNIARLPFSFFGAKQGSTLEFFFIFEQLAPSKFHWPDMKGRVHPDQENFSIIWTVSWLRALRALAPSEFCGFF
jgi:hypothetical protein